MAGSAYFVLEGADGDGLGASIGTAGNFDAGGSGIDEFIIGSSNTNGLGVIILTGASSDVDGIPDESAVLGQIKFTTPAGEGAGAVVLGGYDFNNDGVADVAISAPEANDGAGAVYVIYGSATALNDDLSAADLLNPLVNVAGYLGIVINGLPGSDGFGASLGATARVGEADLLYIGAPSFGSDSEADQGAVLEVDLTGLTSVSLSPTDYTYFGINGGDAFGTSIAADADLDGDGIGDLAIGAPGLDGSGPDNGQVVITLSSTGDTIRLDSKTSTSLSGTVVSSAGDFNGNGRDDLLVLAPGSGTVYILFGKATAAGFEPAYDLEDLSGVDGMALTGLNTDPFVELVATNVGDVSGDGFDDLLIASVDASGAGRAYLVFGGAGTADELDLETLDGSNGYIFANMDLGLFASSITAAGLGDVNNDGINDIALGAPDAGALSNGQVLGLLGGTENLRALDELDGTLTDPTDGKIDVSNFFDGSLPDAGFIATNSDVTFGGTTTGAINVSLGETTAEGTISIVDVSTDGPDRFPDPVAPNDQGFFGSIEVTDVIDDDTDRWIYTLTTGSVLFLGAGETVADRIILTADNGRQRAINITITGKDDPAEFVITPHVNGVGLTEDAASISGAFSVLDPDLPDQNDNRDLSGKSIVGKFGTFIVSDDGTEFTYVLTADLSGLSSTQSEDEVFEPFGEGGGSFTLTIEGREEFSSVPVGTGSNYELVAPAAGEGAVAFFGAGNEDVLGTAEGDTIDGGAGNDEINGAGGNDIITDSFGNDRLSGGKGNDDITALSGTNTIDDDGGAPGDSNYFKGGVGRDSITGGAGDDFIDGDAASSMVGASDTLDGDAGDDYLRGGLGADTFIFGEGYGNDTIADFNATWNGNAFVLDRGSVLRRDFTVGLDRVEISGFGGLNEADIADALSETPTINNATFTNVNGNAVLTVGGYTADSLTFWGVTVDQLTVDSFIFD